MVRCLRGGLPGKSREEGDVPSVHSQATTQQVPQRGCRRPLWLSALPGSQALRGTPPPASPACRPGLGGSVLVALAGFYREERSLHQPGLLGVPYSHHLHLLSLGESERRQRWGAAHSGAQAGTPQGQGAGWTCRAPWREASLRKMRVYRQGWVQRGQVAKVPTCSSQPHVLSPAGGHAGCPVAGQLGWPHGEWRCQRWDFRESGWARGEARGVGSQCRGTVWVFSTCQPRGPY